MKILAKRLYLIHPLLLATVAPLSLYSENVRWMHLAVLGRPIFIFFVLTIVLWFFLSRAVRNPGKSAVLTSIIVVSFSMYGRLYNALNFLPRGIFTGAWCVASLSLVLLVCKSHSIKPGITKGIDIFAALLVLFPLGIIVNSTLFNPYRVEIPSIQPSIHLDSSEHYPNIIYIILDGAGRHDILKNYYGYDDSWFLDSLGRIGFHILRESRSNYGQTMMSLASSLNLSYIDEMISSESRLTNDRRPLRSLIENAAVFTFVKSRGYGLINVYSGYTGTELREGNYFLSPFLAFNEFDLSLMSMTAFQRLLDLVKPDWEATFHRRRILFALHNLRNAILHPGPLMVFAHIVAPHPPFVFGQLGERLPNGLPLDFGDGTDFVQKTSRAEYVHRYRDQMQFVEKQILLSISSILESSSEPPVIIIQGDHGPGSLLDWERPEYTDFQERLGILNALYLPGQDSVALSPAETPVNTFRIVFNRYFNTSLPILRDSSLFSSWRKPYEYLTEIRSSSR